MFIYTADVSNEHGRWMYAEQFEDEGDRFHPYYELVRRSSATAAFASVGVI